MNLPSLGYPSLVGFAASEGPPVAAGTSSWTGSEGGCGTCGRLSGSGVWMESLHLELFVASGAHSHSCSGRHTEAGKSVTYSLRLPN